MRKKNLFFTVVALLLLGFTYRYYPQQLEFLNTLASYVAYPILSVNTYIVEPIKVVRGERKTMQQLRALVSKLSQERENLQQQVIALQGKLHYAQDTEELQQFAQRYDVSRAKIVQVITKIFSHEHHYFLIDAGKNKGIEPDMVAVYKNCLLGRVIKVYPWYSKVVLITDRSCKVAALCSQTKAKGIHEGINRIDETQLSFVSRLDSLRIGDMINSSGEGLVFPRGFGLGIIKEFSHGELHYTVHVEPLIDFSTISYCYVIKKGNE